MRCGAWLCLLGVVACVGDSDGDGLTNKEEAELGTDPKVADTDGDGLSDGEELALGTDLLVADSDSDGLSDGEEVASGFDPLEPDMDGDGYLDGWEVREGSDPTDELSLIYAGGWPYNPNKDALGDPGYDSPFKVGDLVARHRAKDQFREDFDLYDVFDQGVPVIIDWSAVWCGPCNEMSDWLEGANVPSYAAYKPVRDAIDEGRMIWVTVLVQGPSGRPATPGDAERWFQSYPHPNVPVVVDKDQQFYNWTKGQYLPTLSLVGADGRVIARNNSNSMAIMTAALGLVSQQ